MALSTSTSTLAVGASRTFNLSPGSALTLGAPPNVRATVTETPNTVNASGVGGNASRVHNLQLGQTVTYGPYPMGGTVVVANASNSGTAITWVRSDSIVAESASGSVSLVSGDGAIISMAPTLMTLAAMLAYAPTTDGVEVYVTDLPSGTRGRFYWHLASSKWRPAGMVLVDRSLTLDSGVNSTAEQYIKSLSIPAGLLFTGAEILFEYSLGRSNTTDAGAASNLRIGNLGTISDTAFGNGSGFVSATGSVRAFGNAHRYRVVSGTEIEKAGNGSTAGASFSASGSSLALAPWTVGSTTSRLYFATTVQLAAATGSTLPQVGYSALWLLPS
jgi:hypothetical protein